MYSTAAEWFFGLRVALRQDVPELPKDQNGRLYGVEFKGPFASNDPRRFTYENSITKGIPTLEETEAVCPDMYVYLQMYLKPDQVQFPAQVYEYRAEVPVIEENGMGNGIIVGAAAVSRNDTLESIVSGTRIKEREQHALMQLDNYLRFGGGRISYLRAICGLENASGVGGGLLANIIQSEAAVSTLLVLWARPAVIGFYTRYGFIPVTPFPTDFESGLVCMVRDLSGLRNVINTN